MHPVSHTLDDDWKGAPAPAVRPSAGAHRPRRVPRWAVLLAVLLTALAAAWAARGRGLKTRLLHRLFPDATRWMSHPSVALFRPGTADASTPPDESAVPPDAFFSCEVSLPNSGKVVDPATVNDGSVRLLRAGDGQVVPAAVNTSAAGDVIVLKPLRPLERNTRYVVQVLPALRDTGGASFRLFTASFTTAASVDAVAFPAAFEKVALPATKGHAYTGLTFGPDGLLYACTYDGYVLRFAPSLDGTLGPPDVVLSPATTGGPRLVTGICFDPDCTPDDPVLWVSHGQSTTKNADDWTGKLGRLSGPGLKTYQDVLVGLPRGVRDHLNNQIAFGPDGACTSARPATPPWARPTPAGGTAPSACSTPPSCGSTSAPSRPSRST